MNDGLRTVPIVAKTRKAFVLYGKQHYVMSNTDEHGERLEHVSGLDIKAASGRVTDHWLADRAAYTFEEFMRLRELGIVGDEVISSLLAEVL